MESNKHIFHIFGIGKTQVNLSMGNSKIKAVQNNGVNKKTKKDVVLFIIINMMIITIILVTIFYINAYLIYCRYMDNADSLKKNNNYIQAAEEYYNALKQGKVFVFNPELSIKATCKVAGCYLLNAFEETDNDITLQYYAKAAGLYGEIINNNENKNMDSYVDALSGLSFVYSQTEHILNDEWGMLIELLLKEVEKVEKIDIDPENDNIDDEFIYRWMKAYAALGEYYCTAIKTDYSFVYNPLITNAALKCYERYNDLLDLIKKKNKEIELSVDPIEYDKIRAELIIFIARSPYIENPYQYAKQVIDLCQTYLNDASNYIKDDMESYITFKKFLADSYRILAKYYSYDNEKSDGYMMLAYDELIPLINMGRDNIALELIVDVGYSAIFTGYCSDAELNKILDNFQELLLQSSISEKPKEIAWYVLGICDACKYIIENYGYSEQEAWEMGKQVSGDIKNIEEYVQGSQKVFFNEFYNYFHQDISEIENNLVYDSAE